MLLSIKGDYVTKYKSIKATSMYQMILLWLSQHLSQEKRQEIHCPTLANFRCLYTAKPNLGIQMSIRKFTSFYLSLMHLSGLETDLDILSPNVGKIATRKTGLTFSQFSNPSGKRLPVSINFSMSRKRDSWSLASCACSYNRCRQGM